MDKNDVVRVADIVSKLGKFPVPEELESKGKLRFDNKFCEILQRIVSIIDDGKMASLLAMDTNTQE
jgi:hypothetical protein